MATIGDRLSQILDHYHLSQAELAERIKMSEASVSKAINGVTPIGGKTILNFLAAFPEVNADWFIRGRGEMLIENNKVSFFQEEQGSYAIRHDLYNFHQLVEKVAELEQIVINLQKNIK